MNPKTPDPERQPHPKFISGLLRALAQGPVPAELAERFPELRQPSGQAALQRVAYHLENRTGSEEAWMLSEILEHMPEMVFVKDARDLSFVRLNAAAERLMGFSREEMLGRTDYDFFPAHEAEFFQAKDREVLQSGTMLDIPQEQIQTRHGSRMLHTQKVPILDGNGEPRYLAGVSRDITAFLAAQQEIERTHLQLRRLSARLQQAQEEERRRLAREIHDELGQVLTGLKIELSWVENHLPENRPDLDDHLEQAQQLVNSTLSTVRRVATQLRPQILDDLGLRAALDWLLQETCSRASLASTLDFQVSYKVDRDTATTVFRACQEALTNVVRHAQAQSVSLRVQELPQHLEVEIQDDGIGFDPKSSAKTNWGLVGIRERVQLQGGELELSSSPTSIGTSLLLRLPRD